MQTIRFYLICLAIVIAIFTISRQAPAQFFGQPTTYHDFYGGSWNNGGSALASTMIWNCVYYPLACKKSGGASKGTTSSTTAKPTSQPSPTVKAANPNVVNFRPTGTYIKTRELADSLGNSPAEREQYQKLMNAVLDAFGQQAQKAGFPNDLPAALAFFLGENIRIYRGMPDLSDQQYVDLRNKIADAVISSGAISSLSDRQKQEMYETLVAYTGITQYGYEQGVQAQNDAIVKGYQKVAGQSLQTVTKMSPDNINVTSDGLTVTQLGQ